MRRLAIVLVLALSACSSRDEAPEATVAMDDRIRATIEVPGGPGPLLALGDHLWVQTRFGLLVRIDPATDRVDGDVQVSSSPCWGLGAGSPGLLACDGRDLARVDPETFEVVETIAADKIAEQTDLSGPVISGDGDQIQSSGGPLAPTTMDLGVRCTEAVPGFDIGLWLSCPAADLALYLGGVEDTARVTIDLPGIGAIAGSTSEIWAAYDAGIAHLGMGNGRFVGTVPVADVVDLWADTNGRSLWALSPGRLVRIDARFETIEEEIDLPTDGAGFLTVTDEAVWVSDEVADVVYRVRHII